MRARVKAGASQAGASIGLPSFGRISCSPGSAPLFPSLAHTRVRRRSGMFTANDFGVNYLIQSLPFGGVKESGFDRFAGPEGLRACCLERSMVVDRIPGVKTSIPPVIDYPIDTRKGMLFGSSLVNILYNESWLEKIKAVFGIIKASA